MKPFTAKMPQRPPHQKHAKGHSSDNYGFLRSLRGDQCADVNLTWFWNDWGNRTKAGGGVAYGLHWPDPDRNGYEHIMDGGRCRRMTKAERRRTEWPAAEVLRWRRGPSRRSARPRTYDELTTYVKRNGGTVVGELKSQAFALQWVMEQLVETARRNGHAPWFKALFNMKKVEGKCAATVHAGGQFALIFGDAVHGRAARLRRGQDISSTWTVKPSAIW